MSVFTKLPAQLRAGSRSILLCMAMASTLLMPLAHAQLLPKPATAPATAPAAAPVQKPAMNADQLALSKLQDVNDVMAKLEEYKSKNDLLRQSYALRRLSEMRPYAGGLLWELARTYALLNDRSGAYDAMLKLQQQGFNYDPTGDVDFKNLQDTKVYKYIVQGLQANAKPFGGGKVAFTIQSDVEQLESLAFDPTRNRFLAASASTGEILAVDLTGKTSAFIAPNDDNGLFGVFSLLVDPARNAFYVGSTAIPSYKKFDTTTFGQGGIFQFELSTGKFVKKFPIPFDGKAHVISAMAVAPSGEVYATDAATNAIYQLRAGKLNLLFQSPELVSVRGVAVTDDHKFLYISDYERGLFVASLERSEVRQLVAVNQNFGGIDGVYSYKNQIIAIQNGTSPMRVLRASLGGQGVSGVKPLEANKADLQFPTFGTLKGNQLYFIANSQRDYYDGNGKIVPGHKPERRKIYVVNADFAQSAPLPMLAPTPGGTPGGHN
jgi:hypothetical protein